MHRLLLIPAVLAASLFTGCVEEGGFYGSAGSYSDGPGYYGGGVDRDYDTDFVYVESRPYSRYYGPLYLREGRYYYSRGGSYHVYERGRRGRSYVGPEQRGTNQLAINRYRQQQAVREYQNEALYAQNKQKIRDYRLHNDLQQAQTKQRWEQQKTQYAYQQKQQQYRNQVAIQQYQATHSQAGEGKKKKKDKKDND